MVYYYFKKKYHGHELKIMHNGRDWVGSCICGEGKFHGVQDKELAHRQFTEHLRDKEVFPLGF